jgi:6-phosphogluconolactonase (cycloisomerase 2 family)
MANYGFIGPVGNSTLATQTANGVLETWEQLNAVRLNEYPLNSVQRDTIFNTFIDGYTNNSLTTTTAVRNHQGIEWRPDGRRMYVLGTRIQGAANNHDAVFEYSMTQKWNVATGTIPGTVIANIPTGPYINLQNEIVSSKAIRFGDSGKKMFILDTTFGISSKIVSYNLGTGWSVNTSVYNSNTSVSDRDNSVAGFDFNPDGTTMYLYSNTSKLTEYSLSQAWNVQTAAYVQNVTPSPSPFGISALYSQYFQVRHDGLGYNVINPDGTVYQYNMATTWNVQTAGYAGRWLANTLTTPNTFFIGREGSEIYYSNNATIRQRSLNFKYKTSNTVAFYGNTALVGAGPASLGSGFYIRPNGLNLYVPDFVKGQITEHVMTDAWQIQTANIVFDDYLYTNKDAINSPSAVFFKEDGTKLFVVNYDGTDGTRVVPTHSLRQYDLSTPWNLKTAVYNSTVGPRYLNIAQAGATLDDPLITQIYFSPDGSKFYYNQKGMASIKTVPLATPWDITANSFLTFQPINDPFIRTIEFSSNGKFMYAMGNNNPTTKTNLYRYVLNTPFDPSSGFANLTSVSVPAVTNVNSMRFVSNGSVIHFLSTANSGNIFQYTLNSPYDLTSGLSLNYTANVANVIRDGIASVEDFQFNSDGTEMYVLSSNTDSIHKLTLTTPYNINTAKYARFDFNKYPLSPPSPTAARTFKFANNGTIFFGGMSNTAIPLTTANIHMFALSTAYDVNTASYTANTMHTYALPTYTLRPGAQGAVSIDFSPNGSIMLIANPFQNSFHTHFMSLPYRLDFIDATKNIIVANSYQRVDVGSGADAPESSLSSARFGSNGFLVYSYGTARDRLVIHPCNTAYDITTMGYQLSTNTSTGMVRSQAMHVTGNGNYFFITGASGYANGANVIARYAAIKSHHYEGLTTKQEIPLLSGISANGLFVNADGTGLFVASSSATNNFIRQLNMTTSSNLTSAVYTNFSNTNILNNTYVITGLATTGAAETFMRGITFSANGRYIYYTSPSKQLLQMLPMVESWNVATIVPQFGPSANLNLVANNARQAYIKPDGTKLFRLFSNGVLNGVSAYAAVHEYALPLPYEMGSSVYRANVALSALTGATSSQSGFHGLAFSNDGLKMCVTANTGVFSYNLTEAWNVQTAAYIAGAGATSFTNTVNRSHTAGKIQFNDTGTRLYILGMSNSVVNTVITTQTALRIYQYNLSQAWNVSTASVISDANSIYGLGAASQLDQAFAFSSNGLYLYTTLGTNEGVIRYTLNQPWEIPIGNGANLATWTNSISTNTTGYRVRNNIIFHPDGNSVYYGVSTSVAGDMGGSPLFRYRLPNAWDFQGANAFYTANVAGSMTVQSMSDIDFSDDGSKLFLMSQTQFAQYAVVNPYNLANIILINTTTTGAWNKGDGTTTTYALANLASFSFSGNGSYLHTVNTTTSTGVSPQANKIVSRLVKTPYDANSALVRDYVQFDGTDTNILDIRFTSNGSFLYTLGNSSDSIREYYMTVPWEVSTANVTGSNTFIGKVAPAGLSIDFNDDYSSFFVMDQTAANGVSIHTANLTTGTSPRIDTAAWEFFYVGDVDTNPKSFSFNANGKYLYVTGSTTGNIHQYTIANNWANWYGANIGLTPLSGSDKGVGNKYGGNNITSFRINDDGTRYYTLDSSLNYGAIVDQYKSTLPNDATTFVNMHSYSVISKEALLHGFFFTPTGNAAYFVSNAVNKFVNQIEMSNNFDLSTGIISGANLAITYNTTFRTGDAAPTTMFISNTGNTLYVMGTTNSMISHYPMTSDWQIVTANNTNLSNNYFYYGDVITAGDIYVSPDGVNLYVVGYALGKVNQYTMTTPYELSTLQPTNKEFYTGNFATTPAGLTFGANGSYMYILNQGTDTIYQCNLTTAWDVTTAQSPFATYTTTVETVPLSVAISANGSYLYVTGTGSDTITRIYLPTKWQLTGATGEANLVNPTGISDTQMHGVWVSPRSNYFAIVGQTNQSVYLAKLATAGTMAATDRGMSFNLTSLLSNVASVSNTTVNGVGVQISGNGKKMYVLGDSLDTIYQFDVDVTGPQL